MITRIFGADIVPADVPALGDWLATNAWAAGSTSRSSIVGKPGCLGGAYYADMDPTRPRIYIATHWLDETSIAAHVGPGWLTSGVSNPEESQYFAGNKSFRHLLRINGTE